MLVLCLCLFLSPHLLLSLIVVLITHLSQMALPLHVPNFMSNTTKKLTDHSKVLRHVERLVFGGVENRSSYIMSESRKEMFSAPKPSEAPTLPTDRLFQMMYILIMLLKIPCFSPILREILRQCSNAD